MRYVLSNVNKETIILLILRLNIIYLYIIFIIYNVKYVGVYSLKAVILILKHQSPLLSRVLREQYFLLFFFVFFCFFCSRKCVWWLSAKGCSWPKSTETHILYLPVSLFFQPIHSSPPGWHVVNMPPDPCPVLFNIWTCFQRIRSVECVSLLSVRVRM